MINQNSKAERGSGSATGSQSTINHVAIRGGSPSSIRPTKKIDMVAAVAARLTQSAGGSRVAQDIAAIYAKSILREGRSGATAVQLGYQAGLRMIETERILRPQLGFDR
jgi:hypothetical protein